MKELNYCKNLVIIGASTGGCAVLNKLFKLMPHLQASFLVVQHMPKYINKSFVKTLGNNTPMPVKVADEGDILKPGLVLVAPSDQHCTVVHNTTIHLYEGPKVNYVCPAIDITMQSIKKNFLHGITIGVILTGMGKDGAAGIVHMKEIGAITIAQEKSSCAVPSMPNKAIEAGCVDYIMSPEEISRYITEILTQPANQHQVSLKINHQ